MRSAFAFMTLAGTLYVVGGLTLVFAPDLFFPTAAGAPQPPGATLLAQLYGAALLGLGAATSIARRSPVGGIYGRALIAGNFIHAAAATLVLARPALTGASTFVRVLLVFAAVLAVAFAVLLFDLGNKRRGLLDVE